MGGDMVLPLAIVVGGLAIGGIGWELSFIKKTNRLDKPLGSMQFDVYLINLQNSKDRLKAFRRVYTQCDLSQRHSLIRFEAVNGKALPLTSHVSPKALEEILEAERLGYRSKHYQLTRGGIGCWLSHVNLWKTVLQSDKECALVFEDDAFMALNMEQLLHELRPPTGWDVVLLGHVCRECPEQEQGECLEAKRFFGLHGYIIHRRGIEKFLESRKGKDIDKQIDSVLSDMAQEGVLKIYAAPDTFVWQNNNEFGTTIQMPLRKQKGVNVWE